MFKLSERYEVGRKNLKCDFIRYSPSETSTINTAKSQIHNNIPREDSLFSLLKTYFDLNLMYSMLLPIIDT